MGIHTFTFVFRNGVACLPFRSTFKCSKHYLQQQQQQLCILKFVVACVSKPLTISKLRNCLRHFLKSVNREHQHPNLFNFEILCLFLLFIRHCQHFQNPTLVLRIDLVNVSTCSFFCWVTSQTSQFNKSEIITFKNKKPNRSKRVLDSPTIASNISTISTFPKCIQKP